jgi:adenosyl cobinamide kinase/adenosyl cobinamide phosphate guanylyltransferase
MAGFRKAKAEQAAIKMGIYGPAGSGKTFTALLLAEGLAKKTGTRVAYVDTEHGTDFYCKAVPTRRVHPEAFDFDAIYTRSITEVEQAVKSLGEEYGVVVIDSITHLWEAAIASYSGKQTSAGTIPMYAWSKIKKPYKSIMAALLSSKAHVIICGRQGVEYATNEETEELQAVGFKMKAEGETAYEPHILIRMESVKPRKTNEIAQIVAYAEKDRTGVLSGRSFVNPTFEILCGPILPLLGEDQAKVSTIDETAAQDAETIGEQDRVREAEGESAYNVFMARITMAMDMTQLKEIGRELTPKVKSKMGPDRVDTLRNKYQAREQELIGRLV